MLYKTIPFWAPSCVQKRTRRSDRRHRGWGLTLPLGPPSLSTGRCPPFRTKTSGSPVRARTPHTARCERARAVTKGQGRDTEVRHRAHSDRPARAPGSRSSHSCLKTQAQGGQGLLAAGRGHPNERAHHVFLGDGTAAHCSLHPLPPRLRLQPWPPTGDPQGRGAGSST